MRYVLMKAPQKEEDCNSQIIIIDNSKIIGKQRVENLVKEGYTYVGTVESELEVHYLQRGFSHNADKEIDVMHGLFQQISTLADSHIELAYKLVY